MLRLSFDRGTLLIHPPRDGAMAAPETFAALDLPGCVYDRRVRRWRAPAMRYREVLTALHRGGHDYADDARAYATLALTPRVEREPYPYQREAVAAWMRKRRGVIVLPTGAGKTWVAQMIIARLQRSALVVTPTLDLMQQWFGALGTNFELPIGLLGGGYHDIQPLTVTTYDSAYLHMERLGDRFGLLIFDEVHHLPSPAYGAAAEMAIAPFRLGLTATPEREDGAEVRLDGLVGPEVYRRDIQELSGRYLADYETVTLRVRLSPEERAAYEAARAIYRGFVAERGIRLGGRHGWSNFLMHTSRSEAGRRAFLAYRAQKTIAQASEAKLRLLAQLLVRHRHDRLLIFTSDNATVYAIARRFLIPPITHQTKVKERHAILQAFNDGRYPFVVTSRVLNEGVDVPAASVGVVLSGSGSVREHVQRLGRILRRGDRKQAVLYEVIAEDTAEEYTSARRRQHSAYQDAAAGGEAPPPDDRPADTDASVDAGGAD
ncbi:MAG: DEAD/DEAH box helicase family protein [Acidobacteriota bacterium]